MKFITKSSIPLEPYNTNSAGFAHVRKLSLTSNQLPSFLLCFLYRSDSHCSTGHVKIIHSGFVLFCARDLWYRYLLECQQWPMFPHFECSEIFLITELILFPGLTLVAVTVNHVSQSHPSQIGFCKSYSGGFVGYQRNLDGIVWTSQSTVWGSGQS